MPWTILPPPLIACGSLDPYLFWAMGSGAEDFLLSRQTQSVPLLVEWDVPRARDFADKESDLPPDVFDLWRLLAGPNPKERFVGTRKLYDTRFIPVEILERFFSEQFQELLAVPDRMTLGPPLPRRANPDGTSELRQELRMGTAPRRAKAAPGPVIVGVIDDGIAFGHERFRKSGGTTRVEFVWIQDGDVYGPGPFEYGRHISKVQINAWLATAVDEDDFYRLAGVGDFALPLRSRVIARASHGAHVMDIAAGFDPQSAPDWRIVAVQLPLETTRDSSGSSLTPYAVDAVNYIMKKAEGIAGPGASLPVVINFSYGIVAGPHDGTHPIETAIDDYISTHNGIAGNRPMRVVMPSGNSHLGRAHARMKFRPGHDRVSLLWRVLPEDYTPSFVEIWLPPASAAPAPRIELSVATPDGLESAALGEGNGAVLQLDVNGDVLCEARYCFSPVTQRGMFFIAIQPTARLESATFGPPTGPVAPSGTWTIKLRNLYLTPQEAVDAWIQRDDTPFGHPRRGRQSYFDNACYKRFDDAGRETEEDVPACVIKRRRSINAIATGHQTIVVGGLLRKELRAAKYSAGGPVTKAVGSSNPNRAGPNALAVSDDSVVHAGVLAAGTRSGSVVAMNGTSVAAPLVARWIAGELAAGRPAGEAQVYQLAIDEEAMLPPQAPPRQPARRGGRGRIRRRPANPKPRDERYEE